MTEEVKQPGYHLIDIPKGKLGEWSKVEEEFLEAQDALAQGNHIMLLSELADLYGALDALLKQRYNLTSEDLRVMHEATVRAFASGRRS